MSDFLTAFTVPEIVVLLIVYLRWILIFMLITQELTALYWYGANRKNLRCKWVSWGL